MRFLKSWLHFESCPIKSVPRSTQDVLWAGDERTRAGPGTRGRAPRGALAWLRLCLSQSPWDKGFWAASEWFFWHFPCGFFIPRSRSAASEEKKRYLSHTGAFEHGVYASRDGKNTTRNKTAKKMLCVYFRDTYPGKCDRCIRKKPQKRRSWTPWNALI